MMGTRFRMKPVVIEAIQTPLKVDEISLLSEWLGGADIVMTRDGIAIPNQPGVIFAGRNDWIVKGIDGELSVCKSDTFDLLYEPDVNDEETRYEDD